MLKKKNMLINRGGFFFKREANCKSDVSIFFVIVLKKMKRDIDKSPKPTHRKTQH